MNAPRVRSFWAAIGSLGAATLASCTSPAETYFDNGQELARAGFIAHAADTTARYTMLNQLPPSRLTFRPIPDGGKIYLFADPISCTCVYMGNESSYQRLIHTPKLNRRFMRTILSPIEMATENRQNTASWDWTAWAPSADPGANQPKHVTGASW
ncbi:MULTISPECIES: hypothetical protein [unclassified Saccharibacter]|uniref:hypothetical protein n=1 Tax=unclassified Saccharibacter TaxID=2648722 RepID=UPI00132C4D48|nr:MULTISPECIES: hypothetical protein [unclassified Saccharibacter]MXV36014.1 hypothetical protein [Saccharibacter sp. EH611]MXV56873.1 hypothetical protein [Saccharibacter sp. EH70]MXV66767.1 hypothetical protein [Saccharibacter sp. EH60]